MTDQPMTYKVPDTSHDHYELRADYVINGTRGGQVATYGGNPLEDPDAHLLSGPELRDGVTIHMNSGASARQLDA